MPPAALARPAGVVPGGGVCPFSRLPTPPSLSLTAPIPPAPLPGGKGENQSYFMQGASPLASPGAEPERHLQSQQNRYPAGGVPPAALAIPAPGERTISNAEVPLPRSPLSLAGDTAHRKAVLSVLRRVGDSEGTPPPGAGLAGRASAARVQPPGMQGAKPLAYEK